MIVLAINVIIELAFDQTIYGMELLLKTSQIWMQKAGE